MEWHLFSRIGQKVFHLVLLVRWKQPNRCPLQTLLTWKSQPRTETQVWRCKQFKTEHKGKKHPAQKSDIKPLSAQLWTCAECSPNTRHYFVLVCFKTREQISAHLNHNSCNDFNRVMSIYSSRKSYPKSFQTARSLLLHNRIFHITLC